MTSYSAVKLPCVAPHTGAWIEIANTCKRYLQNVVAPHTGAWIEIENHTEEFFCKNVAPHTGAWIEIKNVLFGGYPDWVAPHTGAWIEIHHKDWNWNTLSSRPTRARGLKYPSYLCIRLFPRRAPHGRVD